MDATPRWIPSLFGTVMILMGALILAAQFGYVPTEGEWLAPPLIILSLGGCLILGGVLLWLPHNSPRWMRTLLLAAAALALVTVCNWSAFAPQAVYSSSTSIGPLSFSSDSSPGARIVFILVAIGVDAAVLSMLAGALRRVFNQRD